MPRLSKIGAACLAAFGFSSGTSGVTASYLIVAGGGGGGGISGGGGGAGGLLSGTTSLDTTQTYNIIVGAGGAGGPAGVNNGSTGSNSTAFSLTSFGGGYGAGAGNVGGNGGSGGGGSANGLPARAGGSGTSLQGNNGGSGNTDNATYNAGGGGGGANAVGSSALSNNASGAAGGSGVASTISGSSVYYAGGGGGGGNGNQSGVGGAGGNGGGGHGAYGAQNAPLGLTGTPGTANLGGGGGGGASDGYSNSYSGFAGGSGVVIVSYAGAQQFGGGVVSYVGGNTIHTFNTSGQLVPLNSLTASYLIVAGGGGGGSRDGGGGGAGGYLTGTGLTLDTGSTYLITVGAGGNGGSRSVLGTQGGNSAISIVSTAAVGGGYGGCAIGGTLGGSGGSGGGNSNGNTTPSGYTVGQGYPGGISDQTSYYGAGGGGAGQAGLNTSIAGGNDGGYGLASSISGSSVYYSGGGGGASRDSGKGQGAGGNGGGGSAGLNSATAGTANTGGGGGGVGNPSNTDGTPVGGNGGSGVVIISYPGTTQLMAGGTVTIIGGNVIHTFTSSGYLAPFTLIGNSLRFRASASAYLSKTNTASPTSSSTWTFSAWVKRGQLTSGTAFPLLTSYVSTTNYSVIDFYNDNIRILNNNSGAGEQATVTTAVYRDPAAWYHVVVSSSASSAPKLYINGVQITAFSSNTAVTTPWYFGSTTANWIGREQYSSTNSYFDGYMAEIRYIDGQSLAASAFGGFNAYGVWQPSQYNGSYGTNGYYLPFSNTTSTTTLGYDFSPAGNNWTTNNISLTAGATYDAMTDVPTLTSATAANYAVMNPLSLNANTGLSNGNLTVYTPGNNVTYTASSMAIVPGNKCYFELTCQTNIGANFYQGVAIWSTTQWANYDNNAYSTYWGYNASDGKFYNNGSSTTYGATWTNGDVIGVAVDMTAGSITFYKNGVSQGVATTSINTSLSYFVNVYTYTTQASLNFGQRPFAYTPPSGYVALNTYNM